MKTKLKSLKLFAVGLLVLTAIFTPLLLSTPRAYADYAEQSFYFIATGYQEVTIEVVDEDGNVTYETITFYVTATEEDIIENFTVGIENIQIVVGEELDIISQISWDSNVISYVYVDDSNVDLETAGTYNVTIIVTPNPELTITRPTPDTDYDNEEDTDTESEAVDNESENDGTDYEPEEPDNDITIDIEVEVIPDPEAEDTTDEDDTEEATGDNNTAETPDNSNNASTNNPTPDTPNNTPAPPNNNTGGGNNNNNNNNTPPPSGTNPPTPPTCTDRWVVTRPAQPAVAGTPAVYEYQPGRVVFVSQPGGEQFDTMAEYQTWVMNGGHSTSVSSGNLPGTWVQTSPAITGTPAVPEQGHWICD